MSLGGFSCLSRNDIIVVLALAHIRHIPLVHLLLHLLLLHDIIELLLVMSARGAWLGGSIRDPSSTSGCTSYEIVVDHV